MLCFVNARFEALKRIILKTRHFYLVDDGARVDAFVDIVHRYAGDFGARMKRICNGRCSRERR